MTRFNIVKMAIDLSIPKLIYRFKAIPTKIPAAFLAEIAKLILKFIWKGKRPQIAKMILKMQKDEGFGFSKFNPSYKTTVIKTMCTGKRINREKNRIKFRIHKNPRTFGQLDTNRILTPFNGVTTVLTNGAATTGYPRTKE